MYNRAIPVFCLLLLLDRKERRKPSRAGLFMGELGRFFCLYQNGANWLSPSVCGDKSPRIMIYCYE
jgi:hypothetical protein